MLQFRACRSTHANATPSRSGRHWPVARAGVLSRRFNNRACGTSRASNGATTFTFARRYNDRQRFIPNPVNPTMPLNWCACCLLRHAGPPSKGEFSQRFWCADREFYGAAEGGMTFQSLWPGLWAVLQTSAPRCNIVHRDEVITMFARPKGESAHAAPTVRLSLLNISETPGVAKQALRLAAIWAMVVGPRWLAVF